MNGETYSEQARQIIRSSESYFPTTAIWLNKNPSAYDPLISLYDWPI